MIALFVYISFIVGVLLLIACIYYLYKIIKNVRPIPFTEIIYISFMTNIYTIIENIIFVLIWALLNIDKIIMTIFAMYTLVKSET